MGIIIIDKDAIMSAEVLKCDLTIDTEVYDISFVRMILCCIFLKFFRNLFGIKTLDYE